MKIQFYYLLGAVFLYFTLWYGVALWRSRNDLADIAWGPGFALGTLCCLILSDSPRLNSTITFAIVSIWAFRLSAYIFLRNRGKEEDFRYRQWRKEWGKSVYWRSYLQVFLLQGAILLVVGIPIWTSLLSTSFPLTEERVLTPQLLLGLIFWTLGFLIESISDYQMFKFKSTRTPSQKVMKSGFWRLSRHPNYFGEAVLWWGIYFVCMGNSAPIWTVIGPITITFLLLRVSGVPMLEKKYKGNLEYQEYQRNTSSFVPWIPAKSKKKTKL